MYSRGYFGILPSHPRSLTCTHLTIETYTRGTRPHLSKTGVSYIGHAPQPLHQYCDVNNTLFLYLHICISIYLASALISLLLLSLFLLQHGVQLVREICEHVTDVVQDVGRFRSEIKRLLFFCFHELL